MITWARICGSPCNGLPYNIPQRMRTLLPCTGLHTRARWVVQDETRSHGDPCRSSGGGGRPENHPHPTPKPVATVPTGPAVRPWGHPAAPRGVDSRKECRQRPAAPPNPPPGRTTPAGRQRGRHSPTPSPGACGEEEGPPLRRPVENPAENGRSSTWVVLKPGSSG